MLRDSIRERGVSFKRALNEAIRAALACGNQSRTPRFVQKSFRFGAEQNFRWDKALAIAEAMEDKEIARKLALRK